jgi:hypothetical protein
MYEPTGHAVAGRAAQMGLPLASKPVNNGVLRGQENVEPCKASKGTARSMARSLMATVPDGAL